MGNYLDNGVEIVEDFTNFCGDTRVVVALCETAEDTGSFLGEGVYAIRDAFLKLTQDEGKPELSVEFTTTEGDGFIIISPADADADANADAAVGANDDLRCIYSNNESYYSV